MTDENPAANVLPFPRRPQPGLARWPALVLVHLDGAYVGSVSSSKDGFCAVSIHRGYCGTYPTFEEAEWAVTGYAQHLCTTVTILDTGELWMGMD